MVMETKLSILDALERHKSGLHLRKLTQVVDGSFPNVRRFVYALAEEGVLKTEHQGNLINITLNDSLQTLAYLKFVHTERFKGLPANVKEACQDIILNIPHKPIVSIVIPSSSQKKKNSYNLILVFQNLSEKDGLYSIVKKISDKHGAHVNPDILDYNSFEERFGNRRAEIYGELSDEGIVMTGVEYYYQLLWRMIR